MKTEAWRYRGHLRINYFVLRIFLFVIILSNRFKNKNLCFFLYWA